MKIEKVSGGYACSCNFCNDFQAAYSFIGNIRNEENALGARICIRCLDELYLFHLKAKTKR